MHEFGPNGAVIGEIDPPPTEKDTAKTPQRPVLAILLGGPLAVILVALFGVLWMAATLPFLPDPALASSESPLLLTLHQTALFCALNIVVFHIIVPITWAVMGLTMLALQAHKKNYSLRVYRLTGIALTVLAIILVMVISDVAKLFLHSGADAILGLLLGAILVGVPTGALLMSLFRRILYWKKHHPLKKLKT